MKEFLVLNTKQPLLFLPGFNDIVRVVAALVAAALFITYIYRATTLFACKLCQSLFCILLYFSKIIFCQIFGLF